MFCLLGGKKMEISANAAVSSALEQKQTANLQQIQVAMFKKSLDMDSKAALQLIDAATQAAAPVSVTSNPPNLGQNIDTTA
jgi:predicted DNA-binding transcriptional regulator YafY